MLENVPDKTGYLLKLGLLDLVHGKQRSSAQ